MSGDRNFSRCPVCGAIFENKNETLTKCPKHQAADQLREAFKAGFLAVVDDGKWTFDADNNIAADLEQAAWEAYERH